MNTIKVNVNFKNRTIYKQGVDLTSGDYNSTKLEFQFDRQDGIKIFEMKSPSGDVVLVKEIINNEVILIGKTEDGNVASLFNETGDYVYEISLYDGESKLTSAFDKIKVKQEQVVIDGEVVTQYLPIFDELINTIQDLIKQVDNVNIDIINVDDTIKVEITKKDGTKESATVSSGGTQDYKKLINLPSINDIDLIENKTTEELGIIKDVKNYIDENKEELKGKDGINGTDGFSPTATIIETDTGTFIEITDKNGTTSAEIRNGTNGVDGYTPIKGKDYFDGEDGYTPQKGIDYFTEEDKQVIESEVITSLTPTLNNNLKDAKDYTDNAIARDFKDITYDENTATFVFTRHDNTTFTVDLPIEQTVKDGRYDDTTNELVLVLVSGQEIKIPVTGLIDDYDGLTSATIQCVVSADNKITCNIVSGSISKTLLTTELQQEINNKVNTDTFTTELGKKVNTADVGEKELLITYEDATTETIKLVIYK